MPVRVYESSDGETFTETVYVTKPVTKTRYVTKTETKYVDVEKVKLVPVITKYITIIVTPTKYLTFEIPKPIYRTRIITTLVSKFSKGTVTETPKGGGAPPIKEPGGGRYSTPSVPKKRRERTVAV